MRGKTYSERRGEGSRPQSSRVFFSSANFTSLKVTADSAPVYRRGKRAKVDRGRSLETKHSISCVGIQRSLLDLFILLDASEGDADEGRLQCAIEGRSVAGRGGGGNRTTAAKPLRKCCGDSVPRQRHFVSFWRAVGRAHFFFTQRYFAIFSFRQIERS